MESRVSKNKKLEIYWFTISYKQIVAWGGAIVLVGALGGFAFFKDYLVRKYNQFLEADNASRVVSTKKNGSFSKLIGTVKVKKFDAVQWINADAQTVLEEGDYIQTSSDSFAGILFPDGTQYRMKPDSLIVVQENSEDPRTLAKKSVRAGHVGFDQPVHGQEKRRIVHNLSVGLIRNCHPRRGLPHGCGVKPRKENLDLFSVSREGARSQCRSINSHRSLRSGYHRGRETDVREVNAAPRTAGAEQRQAGCGTGRSRNQDSVHMVSGSTSCSLQDQNFQLVGILKEPPRGNSHGNPDIPLPVWERALITGPLQPSARTISPVRDSDPNKFTLINKSFREKETDVFLDVKIIRISNIFEIIGRTDPSASVIINEEPVTSMSADGSFKHFTSPLPHKGKNLITITAQDRSGNAKTLTKEVYVD